MRYTHFGLVAILMGGSGPLAADIISYAGNLRSDATVTSCGPGCTLGSSNSDGDYAKFAAVVERFVSMSRLPRR
jgi:hypothetical protein